MIDTILERVLNALQGLDGLAAVVLGGSRARGTAGPGSDYDLGLYYLTDAPLNIPQLQSAIESLVDEPTKASVSQIGGWGPWINGGGWLTVAGKKVDLLYRDLIKVSAVIAECKAGEISMHYQPGHPHGFCSTIWMGEVALCRPLSDPNGEVENLKKQTFPFPDNLKKALIARYHWEILFSIQNAETAILRGEQIHIAGCVYRALCCISQVLFAVNGRYLINEKGALAETESFPIRINGAVGMTGSIWEAIGAKHFSFALQLLREMAKQVDEIVH